MGLKTYDCKKVLVSWLGRPFAEGRAKQAFVKTVRNSERSTFQPNAEGGGTRSISSDRSAKIYIKTTQASDSHHLLTQLFALSDEENVGAFELRDINGQLLERAARAYPQKEPDSEFSVEAGEREWVLETDELIRTAEGTR